MNNRITRNAAIIQLLFVSLVIIIVMLFRQYERTGDPNYSAAMYWTTIIGVCVLVLRINALSMLIRARRRHRAQQMKTMGRKLHIHQLNEVYGRK
jgi:type VI protein secretion system component VasK